MPGSSAQTDRPRGDTGNSSCVSRCIRVLQREPTAPEIDRGIKLMADLEKSEGKTPDEALRYFCLVALNLDEFIYLS